MPSKSSQNFPKYSELANLISVGDWVRFCASQMERSGCFYGHGFDYPWSEAQFLVLRALQLDWDVSERALDGALIESERSHLYSLIEQRCVAKIPSAYLLEEAWFFNEPFRVNANVLVPRSPIAELIETEFAPWVVEAPQNLLDLCTGSGCIGIAMARMFPQAHVDVSDLSNEAITIAIENISAKELGYQVDAFQGDLFDGLPETQYDVIVSNPPYVDAEDIDDMPEEFSHEPKMGLAAGDDGLSIVRKILQQASDYLTDNGWLICEVGNSAVTLMNTFPSVPFQWPEFAQGGHGVFVISCADLKNHQKAFV